MSKLAVALTCGATVGELINAWKVRLSVETWTFSRFKPVNSNLAKMSSYNPGCNLVILLCLLGDCQVGT